jgi:hypothetical protein
MDVASADTPLSSAGGKAPDNRGHQGHKHQYAHLNDITRDDAICADWVVN